MKSRLGSFIKLWLERNEKFQEFRRYIHYGDEYLTDLHVDFNKYCDQMDSKPADIWLILGLIKFLAAVTVPAYVGFKILTAPITYDHALTPNSWLPTKDAQYFYNTPNVLEPDTRLLPIGVSKLVPEAVTRPAFRKVATDLYASQDL